MSDDAPAPGPGSAPADSPAKPGLATGDSPSGPPPAAASAAAGEPGLLYVLAGCVLAGALLSPAVFGRLAPEAYQDLLVGGRVAATTLRQAQGDFQERLVRLQESGVTEAAIEEMTEREQPALAVLEAQAQAERQTHRERLTAWVVGLALAGAAAGVVEALFPAGSRARRRAAVLRTAAVGAVLTLALAQPALLLGVPWLLVAAVAVAALLLAAIAARG